jgi:hypothetical protein
MILDYVHHQFETICWHMIHLHPKQKKMGERYGLTLTSSESFFLVHEKIEWPSWYMDKLHELANCNGLAALFLQECKHNLRTTEILSSV